MVTVLIAPTLDADHYSELYEIACKSDESADELKTAVRIACNRWGRTVHFG
jgi:hypothetical protein